MTVRLHTFPVATHTYFRVINQAEQRRRFLKDATYTPMFLYGKLMDEARVNQHLLEVTSLADSRAQTSLQLVLRSIQLQKDPTDQLVKDFRTLNQELFGEPQKQYLADILGRLHAKVTPSTQAHWDYIAEVLPGDYRKLPQITPAHNTFLRYKQYFLRYLSEHHASLDPMQPLAVLVCQALEATGLSERGWRLVERDNSGPAYVHHYNKTVYVGRSYTPRTKGGAARIVVHEVYGHALRGYQNSVSEGEGFAILLEQLLDNRFMFKRAARYLAAGLGWGSLTKPMTLRQVHEIIWRMMVIVGTYDVEHAKEYAFDECVRVFRGGHPAVAGAVYLKDSLYFEANIAIWHRLENDPLEYNEFVDLVEGRRKILS